MKRYLLPILTVLLLAFLLIAGTGTRGGLAYFSPDTLEFHTQSEFTILGGEVPVWRSYAKPSRREMIEIAQSKGWLIPQATDEPRWELVYHANGAWRDGHGDIYGFLCRSDESICSWMEEHPDLAEHYWREGFSRYRSKDPLTRYIGVQFLTTAWRCKSIAELDDELKRLETEIRR